MGRKVGSRPMPLIVWIQLCHSHSIAKLAAQLPSIHLTIQKSHKLKLLEYSVSNALFAELGASLSQQVILHTLTLISCSNQPALTCHIKLIIFFFLLNKVWFILSRLLPAPCSWSILLSLWDIPMHPRPTKPLVLAMKSTQKNYHSNSNLQQINVLQTKKNGCYVWGSGLC